MELPAILQSPDKPTTVARSLAALGAILLALGVTGPLVSVGIGPLAKTVTFDLVSPARVHVLLAIAAATLVLSILGRTRWVIWSAAAILVTFGSMVSIGGEKSSMEMPGWVSDILGSIAKGAMQLVTFNYGTPCLALGILLILGVGIWRMKAAA